MARADMECGIGGKGGATLSGVEHGRSMEAQVSGLHQIGSIEQAAAPLPVSVGDVPDKPLVVFPQLPHEVQLPVLYPPHQLLVLSHADTPNRRRASTSRSRVRLRQTVALSQEQRAAAVRSFAPWKYFDGISG